MSANSIFSFLDSQVIAKAINHTDVPTLNDVGNAERLNRRHGNDIIYVPGIGWHITDGKRWKRDDINATMELARDTVEAMLAEVKICKTDDTKKKMFQWYIQCGNVKRLRDMLIQASSDARLVKRADELDNQHHLFNCINGTIDMKTGTMRKHNPADYITALSPVEYNPNATCPMFIKFLNQTFASNVPDQTQQLINYVQTVLGYCMTGDIKEHQLWICYGEGRNGKGTLLDVISYIMGSEMSGLAPETLLTNTGGREHPEDLMEVRGKRLMIAREPEEHAKLNISRVKYLTGDKEIIGRRLYEQLTTFHRQSKFIIQTNHKPKLKEIGDAIQSRLKLIPFENKIAEVDKDKDLGEKLKTEASGILNWLLAGFLEYQKSGFNEPSAVINATKSYMEENDFIAAFIAEKCIEAEWSSTADLYMAYGEYCKQYKTDAINAKQLGKELKRLGYIDATRNNTRGYKGIGFQDDVNKRMEALGM